MSVERPSLILVGPSGSGKTQVGHILSERSALPLCDVDEETEQMLGAPIGNLVIEGRKDLDDIRRAIVCEALKRRGIVVTSTSQVFDSHVCDAVLSARQSGTWVVELSADTAHVARRIGLNGPRSVALGTPRAMLTQMLRAHHEACSSLVDAHVDTCEMDLESVADAVALTCKLSDGRNFVFPDSEDPRRGNHQ